MKFIFGPILVVFLTSACGLLIPGGGSRYQKDGSYSFNIDENVWEKADPDTSDYAFYSPKNGAHIIINSLCKKYDESSLVELSNNILSGIEDLSITSKKKISFQDRDAQKVSGTGKVDGVPIYFKLLTFKRNRCTFDFAYLSIKDSNQEEINSYENLLGSIRFK